MKSQSEQSDSLPRVVVRGPLSGRPINCEMIDGNPYQVKVRVQVYDAAKGLRYEEHWIDADDVLEVDARSHS